MEPIVTENRGVKYNSLKEILEKKPIKGQVIFKNKVKKW